MASDNRSSEIIKVNTFIATNPGNDPDGTLSPMTPTTASTETTEPIGKPPMTLRQWLQVLSASAVFLNTWGILLTFGVFQTYYKQILLPDKSSSEIAWISTTCAFILLFSGIVTGSLFDYGFLRSLLFAGSLLEVFGLMMLSISSEYYQVFLSQGICVGLGGGMLYVPSIAATAFSLQDFRRAKFIGLIASATGVGGLIYPIMFRQLLSNVGFPWTVRIIALVVLGTYLVSWPILLYEPKKSPTVRRWIDVSAFTDTTFVFAVLAALFSAMAYFLPMLYLPLFAETGVPGFDNVDLAFYLISIANGASVLGRVLAGLIATAIGPFETCQIAVAASTVLLFCWLAVESTAGIIVWSALWGMTSSVIVAMPGAMLPHLSPSLSVLGTRTGMYWAGLAFGILIGPPIAGVLVDDSSPDNIHWWRLQVFAGTFMAAGTMFGLYPLIVVRGRKKSSSAFP